MSRKERSAQIPTDELPFGTISDNSSHHVQITTDRKGQSIPADELSDLHLIEHKMHADGVQYIVGVDEAGRGPLCGVVCAGAVVFSSETAIDGVNDSKKLTESKRESLYNQILDRALAVGVGIAEPDEIDKLNILQATKLACRRALAQIKQQGILPDLLLLDALELPDVAISQRSLIKGDARSFSIAAASIVAKVTRDRLMQKCAEEWPQYGLEKHKGYPTKAHYEAISQYGVSTLHRRSFLHDHDLFSTKEDNENRPLIWSRTSKSIQVALSQGKPIPQLAYDILEQTPPVLPRCEREWIAQILSKK